MNPRRIVLCLDGTWNSTYALKKRDDGHAVFKPSNVLKLARAVLPDDAKNDRKQIINYDIGVGSLAKYNGVPNRVLAGIDKTLGGTWGAGFEANIDRALTFLVLNHQRGDETFIFGFSRGAATAQAVTRFLDWSSGLPVKRDAYYLPQLFLEYLHGRGAEPAKAVIARINERRLREKRPLPPLEPFEPVDVVLLGVWDSVLALGSRVRAGDADGRAFHVGPEPPRCVRHARQALAIDEARSDFYPSIWQGCDAKTQTLEQRWFAGVHSNIGGGYVHDGLANITFHWMIKEATKQGLAVDEEFIKKYPGYPQDRLYRSESAGYRAADAIRRRTGEGRRSLRDPGPGKFTLDRSVIVRIEADPEATVSDGELKHPDLKVRYRPWNVMRFLASRGPTDKDLDAYLLDELGIDASLLPDDVRRAVDDERFAAAQPPGTSRLARMRLGHRAARAIRAWRDRLWRKLNPTGPG